MNKFEMMYRIGDFARLCGTSIDTLLHYDNVGILKPAIKKSNGWRYYQYIQFFTFMTISALKLSGCSLDEIRQYLFTNDLKANRERLNERLEIIDRQISSLSMAKKALQESIESIACAQSQPIDDVRIITLQEESIIVERSDLSKQTFEGNTVRNVEEVKKRLEDFNHLCKQTDFVQKVLPQLLFPKDRIQKGDYQVCLLFRPVKQTENSSNNIQIKPAGLYASMITQGLWPNSFASAYQRIKQFLTDNQLSLSGDVYVYPLKTVCTNNNHLAIVYQILAPVESMNNSTGKGKRQ